MITHVVTIHRLRDVELPRVWAARLKPITLTDPPGMTIHKVYPLKSDIPGEYQIAFSPKILNDSINNERGTWGFLLLLHDNQEETSLASYTSIAKASVRPKKRGS